MTASQQKALDTLWPEYGIEFGLEPLDLAAIFGRQADVVLDIGFGNGESLVDAAVRHPERDFLGVEVHEPGVGHCLIAMRKAGIGNLRIVSHDVVAVLEHGLPPASLARINLLFPDPWPKKRHHKRRLVQRPFLRLAARALREGGALYIATDWAPYAEHIDEVMSDCPWFDCVEIRDHDGDRPLDRASTRFERRGLVRGHRIRDWKFVRNAIPPSA